METLDSTNWLLTALIFVPLAGAAVMAVIPEREEDHAEFTFGIDPVGLEVRGDPAEKCCPGPA